MDYLTDILGMSVPALFILAGICVILFLIYVIIMAWIIKIGVQWGISKSIEDIKIAVSRGILSAKKNKVEKEPEKITKSMTEDPDTCPECGESHPWVHGALHTKCVKCGYVREGK